MSDERPEESTFIGEVAHHFGEDHRHQPRAQGDHDLQRDEPGLEAVLAGGGDSHDEDFLNERPVVAVSDGDLVAVEALKEGHENFTGGAEFLAELGGGGLALRGEVGGDGGDGSLVGFFAEGDFWVEGNDLAGAGEEAVGGFVISSGLEFAGERRVEAGGVEGAEDFGGRGFELGWEFERVGLVADEVVADAKIIVREPAEEGVEEAEDSDGGA